MYGYVPFFTAAVFHVSAVRGMMLHECKPVCMLYCKVYNHLPSAIDLILLCCVTCVLRMHLWFAREGTESCCGVGVTESSVTSQLYSDWHMGLHCDSLRLALRKCTPSFWTGCVHRSS